MRALFSYGLALLICVGIAVWLGTGVLVQGGHGPGNGERPIIALVEQHGGALTNALEKSGAAAEPVGEDNGIDPHLTIAERQAQVSGSAATARSVRTQTFTMQMFPIEVSLRGRTKAKSSVTVAPQTTGIVQQVRVTKGQRVKPGDLLCTIDPGTRAQAVAQSQAALAQAQASLAQAQANLETNTALRQKGIAAENTARALEVAVSSAQAQVTAADAALSNAKAELARTEVHTEVGGVVQAPLASVGSTIAPGAACATVVQLDPMLFTGSVPEARINLARIGLPATVKTITGASVDGKVSYIAATADPATNSFGVEVELPNPDGKVLDGLTAEATVKMGTLPAHLLPQSVLTLDDQGTIGVRTVEEGKVAFHPVTIVSDTRQGVWVTGLAPSVDIITVGQEFVQPGQVVNATNVTAGADTSVPAGTTGAPAVNSGAPSAAAPHPEG